MRLSCALPATSKRKLALTRPRHHARMSLLLISLPPHLQPALHPTRGETLPSISSIYTYPNVPSHACWPLTAPFASPTPSANKPAAPKTTCAPRTASARLASAPPSRSAGIVTTQAERVAIARTRRRRIARNPQCPPALPSTDLVPGSSPRRPAYAWVLQDVRPRAP
ncbi:hypothetical protein DFH06DRAFT_262950 [Mycena polygramma]|nr:hypothetical protein DFH06DRAFT_262950 [Mycena polygramma]